MYFIASSGMREGHRAPSYRLVERGARESTAAILSAPPGDEDHVAGAAAGPGPRKAGRHLEAGPLETEREAGVVLRRPDPEDASRSERGVQGAQPGRRVEPPVALQGDRLGAVVDVEQDGVERRLGAGDGVGHVGLHGPDAWVGERTAGERAEHA